ncbi:Scd6-like Sm domain-containing protein [Blakeslea trispora]|nr:Scd6-like Sm domain-containing protein [Blakeslea trispora]
MVPFSKLLASGVYFAAFSFVLILCLWINSHSASKKRILALFFLSFIETMNSQKYIGSKISLTSFSDIRYVGILHNINPVDSTLVLQNVKSFGTEGRKSNPSEEILASDSVFDYVVFRGTDIKDLQVFEAPPSFQSSSGSQQNYDLIGSTSRSYEPSMPSYAYGSNQWQNADYSGHQPHYPYYSMQNYYQQQPQLSRSFQTNSQMAVTENYRETLESNGKATLDEKKESTGSSNSLPKSLKSLKIQEKTAVSQYEERENIYSFEPYSSQEREAIEAKNADKILVDSLVKQVSELDIMQPSFSKQAKSTKSARRKDKDIDSKRTKSTTNTSTDGSGSFKTQHDLISIYEPSRIDHNNSRGNNDYQHSTHHTLIPKSDFDFASANAKLDKGNKLLDKDHINAPLTIEIDDFYDKKKSFFDDISCESKGYQNG